MTYVFMRVLESAPDRYDRGMAILTLGRLARVHREIARRMEPGWQVLDVGCGTGSLAVLAAQRGARIVGIDISPPMLELAGEQVRRAGVERLVTLREMGVAELDASFDDATFDAVASSLAFSELADDEVVYTLHHCRRLLKPGGLLMVADEVMPSSAVGRALTWLLRLPFTVLAYVLTQNTTRRVATLENRVVEAGFRVIEVDRCLLGTLRTIVAKAGER